MSFTTDLSGKKALITGASSAGFGRFFAQQLSAAGADVVVASRRIDPLKSLVAELEGAGGKADAVALDVTSTESVAAAFKAHGAFDIVVNNAGVSVAKPFLEQTDEDYDFVIDTNLKGVFNVGQAAAKALAAEGKPGSIINIASITGLRQVNTITPYAVSKAAVIQLTKQMALELARYRIRVNAIAPGYFESDLTRDLFETEAGQAMIKRIPMRRLGDYASLAGPLFLLASDASSYMTGSVIAVDGGHLLNSL